MQQEDINIVNIYTLNIGSTKYVKKIFLRTSRKILIAHNYIVGDFNIHCQKQTDLPNKISTKILWN